MEFKEKIEKEIDSIPEEYLQHIKQYLDMIKSKPGKKRIRTLHLKGRFHSLNIRKIAYQP